MRDVIFWICIMVSIVAATHSVIMMMCTRWYSQNTQLALEDFDHLKLRRMFPPWYIRYALWIYTKVLRRTDA